MYMFKRVSLRPTYGRHLLGSHSVDQYLTDRIYIKKYISRDETLSAQ